MVAAELLRRWARNFHGVDLSNLFESKRRSGSMFTSRCSASAIIGKIEGVAKRLNLRVWRVKDFKVRMEGRGEGRKGRLGVTAEVSEIAPGVAVVELSKSSGDTLEYAKLWAEEVRPALKDIVWSWQGEGVEKAGSNSTGEGAGEE